MAISPLAGKPPTPGMLVDVARLVTAYYDDTPDPSVPFGRVVARRAGEDALASDETS